MRTDCASSLGWQDGYNSGSPERAREHCANSATSAIRINQDPQRTRGRSLGPERIEADCTRIPWTAAPSVDDIIQIVIANKTLQRREDRSGPQTIVLSRSQDFAPSLRGRRSARLHRRAGWVLVREPIQLRLFKKLRHSSTLKSEAAEPQGSGRQHPTEMAVPG